MANIATLVEDIYKVLDQDVDHQVSEENIEWASTVFRQVLSSRFLKRDATSSPIRFSSLGKKDRQMWYAAHPPENIEKLPPSTSFKFLYGDLIEVLLLFLAKEAGHDVSMLQAEVEEDGVHGHLDAVIDGVVVDCKSASPYSFNKFKDGSFVFDDPFGYIPQISGYANKLGLTKEAAFLVSEKVSGAITLAPVDQLTIEGNPPGPKIAHLKEIINGDTPPPRCYSDVPEGKSGNRKLDIGCSYCAFKDSCWADANSGQGLRKFMYGRGPVWLTKVAREPRVDESV